MFPAPPPMLPPPRIVEYKVVTGVAGEVSEKVTRLIEEGWHLSGDMQAVYNGSYGITVCQALIKYGYTKD